MSKSSKSSDPLRQAALDYHQFPRPGKFTIQPTKDMATARDLALAYSPGVAVPCEEIAADPSKARDYTTKGNLVAVISNGTAVLGLGDIGALASKPVMEGKAVLFKKFARVNAVDIEIDETDVDKVVDIVASLEPTYGGINLEDFKAPECFEIERRLKERMNIPVFHDDQHGTAIIVAACVYNWARLTKRDLKKVKVAASGAGASALACLKMLMAIGIPKKNLLVCDRKGVIYEGRKDDVDPYKQEFVAKTDARSLEDALNGADIFLGLSAAGALKKEWLPPMNKDPLIMALANPTPEIMPSEVKSVRDDAYIATGRSDFPNQVNNVLCFPFIFRGALDVGATAINEEIKVAVVKALADLTDQHVSDEVRSVYSDEDLVLGREYLIPKPFDPRLIIDLPVAVAKAAAESGVATRPIEDYDAYIEHLKSYVYESNMIMRPVYNAAKRHKRRVAYAEGEDRETLRAVKIIIEENMAHPVLVGRKRVVQARIKEMGLKMQTGKDFDLVDPEDDPRYKEYWTAYYDIMKRQGITPSGAQTVLRTNNTVIAAMLVHLGDADAMLCGKVGAYHFHLRHITPIIGLKPDTSELAAMMLLVSRKGNYFICDTHVNANPSAEEVAHMTVMAAEEIKSFGIEPKVALLAHSNFGSHNDEQATKMRDAIKILRRIAPDLEVDGEMHADAALDPKIRETLFPDSPLTGRANLLVCPCQSSASIAYNMFKVLGDCVAIGPMLLGVNKPVHIMTNATGTRGTLNLTALAAATVNVMEDKAELPLA